MATHRLYYDDSFLQNFSARVVDCGPVEPFADASGTQPAWGVVLDATAFYPSSGGQPNDFGRLGTARVLDVRDDGDEIVHIVDQEISLGAVEGCVDWSRRFDHMQQHTGQHLLSAMFQERFGLPTVSFHLGSDLCTIDLRGPEPSIDILQGAQQAANEVIYQDRAVNVRYGTAQQLTEIGVRKGVDREGLLRAIEIESADLQPCGGTHVKSTGQIGMILARRCTRVRQDWRVEFVCGARADRLASSDFQLAQTLARRLSCAPEDLLTAIEKSCTERESNYKSLRGTLQELAEARGALLASAAPKSARGTIVVAELVRDSHPDLLLPLATEVVKNEGTVAILIFEETGQLVLAKHPGAQSDLAGVLKEILAVFPGKGGGTNDFIRAKLSEPRDSAHALGLAKKLLLG